MSPTPLLDAAIVFVGKTVCFIILTYILIALVCAFILMMRELFSSETNSKCVTPGGSPIPREVRDVEINRLNIGRGYPTGESQ